MVGLAVAAFLAGERRQVYIVEKNESFGLETSSRNSETVHAGIYYPEGSLKAECCVNGRNLLYELCRRHRVPIRQTGKLIVATGDEQVGRLEGLREQGKANGVDDLEMLSRSRMRRLEPNVEGIAALLSPSSGVVDSYSLMRCLLGIAKESGAEVAYRSKVVGIERTSEGYELSVEDGTGVFRFRTDVVVNSAGLHSDAVADLAGIDVDAAGYRLHYCKGEYFGVAAQKERLVERLVYPVPTPGAGGVGIHTVLDIEGRMRLGPSARYVERIEYEVDESQQGPFHDSVKPFLPFIERGDLVPEMAGVRPKLEGPGEGFRDFVIKHESDRGLPGMINLIGIESPGLTGAPAIAERVGKMVREIL